jgi:hypothetical protein
VSTFVGGATFHRNDGEFPLVLCSEVVGRPECALDFSRILRFYGVKVL